MRYVGCGVGARLEMRSIKSVTTFNNATTIATTAIIIITAIIVAAAAAVAAAATEANSDRVAGGVTPSL
jgi:hypothetical protein